MIEYPFGEEELEAGREYSAPRTPQGYGRVMRTIQAFFARGVRFMLDGAAGLKDKK